MTDPTLWACAKCGKRMKKDDLTELFGWGEYVCTPCIETWLAKEKENWEALICKHPDQK
jgi:hypothetical protein